MNTDNSEIISASQKLASIIIPCHNEEGNIDLIYNRIKQNIKDYSFEIVFVDDKSKDSTLQKILELSSKDERVKYISFSKNFGHQNALRAGLEFAKGDCIICMDADLQHPPELIPELINKWECGYDIVYTLRKDTTDTSYFKKTTASFFYNLINKISDIEIEQGSADFRLIDKKIASILVNNITEYHLFYRGLVSWIGFKQIGIEYQPRSRHSGETKYSVLKMLSFAVNGITSFSTKPLRVAILLGLFISFFVALYALYAFSMAVFTDKTVTGWTSVIISVLFIGGVQMVLLGIIGEYLGKLFMQSKHRPYFLIEKTNINK